MARRIWCTPLKPDLAFTDPLLSEASSEPEWRPRRMARSVRSISNCTKSWGEGPGTGTGGELNAGGGGTNAVGLRARFGTSSSSLSSLEASMPRAPPPEPPIPCGITSRHDRVGLGPGAGPLEEAAGMPRGVRTCAACKA